MEIDSTDVKQLQKKKSISVPENELNLVSEEAEAGLATEIINNVEAFTQGIALFCTQFLAYNCFSTVMLTNSITKIQSMFPYEYGSWIYPLIKHRT